MSAVPKKKLCWNCEGNVSREIDNCPYCGVYLHAIDQEEEEETSSWDVNYQSSNKEEIPASLYQSHREISKEDKTAPVSEESPPSSSVSLTWLQLKQDVFPILLLMSGSVFFLFGVILFLFSQNGTLTLQWDSQYWPAFLALSLPFIYMGWKFLQEVESDSE